MHAVPIETSYGIGWVAFDEGRLVHLVLPGGAQPAPVGTPPAAICAVVDRVRRWFAGHGRSDVHAGLCAAAGRTPFEMEVYRVVAAIPPGATRTYREVASAAGRPDAARAVGAAMARNPFAPLVPCHRVVGSDGSLRGYAGGLSMKEKLLEEERV